MRKVLVQFGEFTVPINTAFFVEFDSIEAAHQWLGENGFQKSTVAPQSDRWYRPGGCKFVCEGRTRQIAASTAVQIFDLMSSGAFTLVPE